MRREFSAGGIVFNHQNQVLLCRHSKSKRWGYPKGLIDPGQTSKEAALREVEEEGGVKAEIVDQVGSVNYIYTFAGEKVFKNVTYYLMEYISGDPKDHDWEMDEAGWYDYDQALQTLSFKRDQDLLKKAIKMIKI